MRFSIITPTYKRADKLVRAVQSVQGQTYSDWEMIIVNDSPNDESYTPFASSINDPRIHYHVNRTNSGVNFTRNFALEKVSAQSKWILFLDDDDYLAPDALASFYELVTAHPNYNWLTTNRAQKDGTPLTKIKTSDRSYSYIRDYLLLRRIQGDVTHAISTSCLHHIRFPLHIKQGEEWFFFYQLGLEEKMFYHDHNSTITDGYDAEAGLNFRKRTRTERLETISILFYEGMRLHLAHRPTFLIYIIIKTIKAIFY
jgi:glycosyltransferase involved in cell wall biosynthesis